MNADMKWLDNPEVFKVNQLEPHSDHCYYLDYSDMKKEKNPYYDENDMLKVRPFSYKLNADGAEGSKEDDKIILNTVDNIIKHTLKETADKTGYTKETVYKAIFDGVSNNYFMCRMATAREQTAIWQSQHNDFKHTYDKDYLKGDNFY